MKREGDGMPWTAPRKCKRSRLCVSTAGSPDGHLHLVLHFKRRFSFLSLTPSNHVETAQEHRRKPCVDRRVSGKCEQKPCQHKNHVGVVTTVEDSRHSKWYVSPITHTRNEEKQFRQHEEKRCNQSGGKLAKTKTMSEIATEKLHPDPDRKESKWEVTKVEYKKKQTVTDNQKLSKLNKPGKKPAILEAESRAASWSEECLFPTCPWEVESDDSSDDSNGEKTKEELTESGNKQQTVPDNQQLSKVHEPAWNLQSPTCERTIKSKVQHRNSSCTKADVTQSPPISTGATQQKSTAETGRSEKENFLIEGQSKYARKSEMTTMNSVSLHGQQRQLKNMCKEENIVEILQDKLIITKDCDNTKDFNGPITSTDTSDVIDDVMKGRQPIRKDLGSSSGGSVQNGPITVRNGCAEDDSLATVGMKQASSSVSSPRKLDLEVADLMTLAPHEWLNDNVLNGYFDLLSEARPDDVYCFNTFFYTQLCRKGYQGVRRWTRKVQIFQKSLLLVPLHLGNHWCLAEVAVQDKLLFLYDSRGGANLTCLQRLVSYLCCEAEERGEADFTSGWNGHCREDIPVQETSGDCGVFVCQYARCIVEGRPMDFSQKDMPKFRCQMTQELLQHKLL
ncbi:sentrin specific peptidase 5 [Branchiostoma belcheri]|nr:sentrin specific peptidase 5 [Branchiostoma belcheri]